MIKPDIKTKNSPLSFFLAGGSKIKKNSLEQATWDSQLHAAVIPITQAESNINEQPKGEQEILKGAINRVLSAYAIDPRGDVYFSAENGIKYYEDRWLDYAIVLAYIPDYGTMTWVRSEAVEFPKEAVEITYNKVGGFVKNTVGKTLQEMGIVRLYTDPHLDLVGKSRTVILADSFKELFNYLPQGIFLREKQS